MRHIRNFRDRLRGKDRRHLAFPYWVFVAVWLVVWFFFGIALAVSFNLNPYIVGSITMGLALLWEVYSTARWENRR